MFERKSTRNGRLWLRPISAARSVSSRMTDLITVPRLRPVRSSPINIFQLNGKGFEISIARLFEMHDLYCNGSNCREFHGASNTHRSSMRKKHEFSAGFEAVWLDNADRPSRRHRLPRSSLNTRFSHDTHRIRQN